MPFKIRAARGPMLLLVALAAFWPAAPAAQAAGISDLSGFGDSVVDVRRDRVLISEGRGGDQIEVLDNRGQPAGGLSGLAGPEAMVVDGDSAWVIESDAGRIAEIDLVTLSVGRRFILEDDPDRYQGYAQSIVKIEDDLWFVHRCASPMSWGFVGTVDLSTGELDPDKYVTFDCGRLFPGEANSTKMFIIDEGVSYVDVASGNIEQLGRASVGYVEDIVVTADGASAWVASPGSGDTLRRLSLPDMEIIASVDPEHFNPSALATVGEGMLSAGNSGSEPRVETFSADYSCASYVEIPDLDNRIVPARGLSILQSKRASLIVQDASGSLEHVLIEDVLQPSIIEFGVHEPFTREGQPVRINGSLRDSGHCNFPGVVLTVSRAEPDGGWIDLGSVLTDESGRFTATDGPVPVGSHRYKITWPGDGIHKGVTGYFETEVVEPLQTLLTVSASDLMGTGEEFMVYVELRYLWRYWNPLESRNVTVTFGDLTSSVRTDYTGRAKMLLESPSVPGTYELRARYEELDGPYASTEVSRSIRIQRRTGLTYTGPASGAPGERVDMIAVLRGPQGVPIAGKPIEFQVGNAPVLTAETDAEGRATVRYTLPEAAGTHEARATFRGDALHFPSFRTSTVTTNWTYVLISQMNQGRVYVRVGAGGPESHRVRVITPGFDSLVRSGADLDRSNRMARMEHRSEDLHTVCVFDTASKDFSCAVAALEGTRVLARVENRYISPGIG